MSDLPETVLQFGGGNFLRAFFDVFLHESNAMGGNSGRAVVVQSTDSNRAALINGQQGRYHVVVRGLIDGRPADDVVLVDSISRAMVAGDEWEGVLDLARSPDLRWIVSNTTEAGYRLEPEGPPERGAPKSFPAKLVAALKARFEAGAPGLSVMPCELVEQNGDRLLELVEQQAEAWRWGGGLVEWMRSEIRWANTLVDRIVSGRPASHPLLETDALLTVAEPFALWVVEGEAPFEHSAIRGTDDVRPYALRKVRILNGAHTALVCKALPMGIKTVRAAVEHPETGPWLRGLVFEEIVPTLEGEVEDAEGFADGALERFANPFLDHRLADIALHHSDKVSVRLVPTYEAYVARYGDRPSRLSEILTDYL